MAYSKENIDSIFNEIIFDIENGASLRASLLKDNRPDSTTFYKWIDNEKEKSIQYTRACEKRADSIFEDILNIADDCSGDKKVLWSGVFPLLHNRHPASLCRSKLVCYGLFSLFTPPFAPCGAWSSTLLR